jgi:hypothetical protein
MILHPDGRIEGTPEECTAYKLHQQSHSKPFKEPEPYFQFPLAGGTPTIAQRTCHNAQCHCTGACTRPQGISGLGESLNIIQRASKQMLATSGNEGYNTWL